MESLEAKTEHGPDHGRWSIPDRACIRTQRFAFLLIPNYSMLAFTSALEPLRAANSIDGRNLYDWVIYSPGGASAVASNNTQIFGREQLDDADAFDAIIVCGGNGSNKFGDRKVFNWLRWHARQGTAIGAISDGTYVLARAGLLDGYRCTVHWRYLDAFREEFPFLDVTGELFEIDRYRFTCCGGTGAIDLMLSLVAARHGQELAKDIAENFIHQHIRDGHDLQRMPYHLRLGTRHAKLLRVIEHMENNLEKVVPVSELAEYGRLSERHLERLFRNHVGCPPMRYYLELRLHRARSLLFYTSMSVVEVALACGFTSASHFSRCYRQYFHERPSCRDRLNAVGQADDWGVIR